MTIARRKLVTLDVTPWYHCTSRCVRRSFLCGRDKLTKRNFAHRKKWIEELLLKLPTVFCIDVAAYAVMSNHYHVVVRVNLEKAQSLSDREVFDRLSQIYHGSPVLQRYGAGEAIDDAEKKILKRELSRWRLLLTDLGRFMGYINQSVACRANKEDDCKGRFWESRFSSQAILDHAALVRTLCYVDLNPVRAKSSSNPTQSRFTSINLRRSNPRNCLIPFEADTNEPVGKVYENKNITCSIPLTLDLYCQILEWTARGLKTGDAKLKNNTASAYLDNQGFSQTKWLSAMSSRRGRWHQKALGSVDRIKAYCRSIEQRWIWRESG